MSEIIVGGTGNGPKPLKVSDDNRALTDAISISVTGERSQRGKLWGLGTGSLSVGSSMSNGMVMWFSNDTNDELWHVSKLIFGWNGGSTNFNRTCFSLISYNVSEPSTNITAINANIENIRLSGSNAAVTKNNLTAYKWDGVGDGMTGGTGGFAQIPNRLAQGNTSLSIDGEIILGPGNTMSFGLSPEEDGLFNVAAVFFTTGLDGERSNDV